MLFCVCSVRLFHLFWCFGLIHLLMTTLTWHVKILKAGMLWIIPWSAFLLPSMPLYPRTKCRVTQFIFDSMLRFSMHSNIEFGAYSRTFKCFTQCNKYWNYLQFELPTRIWILLIVSLWDRTMNTKKACKNLLESYISLLDCYLCNSITNQGHRETGVGMFFSSWSGLHE